ncbi:MAG: fibronectin type III domain-containing protein [Treponema sp.]|jgi:hypothetical protein|nr:fibronectin type III domain-containing protein [Treponema sp.]
MKKYQVIMAGICSLMLVFGLALTGCDTGGGDKGGGGILGNVTKPTDGGTNEAITSSAPTAPTGVTATRVSATEVSVTWNRVSGARSYEVYQSYDGSDSSYALDGYPTIENRLSSNSWGYFKVKAFNETGGSAFSTSSSYVGPPSSGGNSGGSAPATPTGVTAMALSSTSVSVSWNSVSGATHYTTYYQEVTTSVSSESTPTDSTPYTEGMDTSTTITDLKTSTLYIFWVRASNTYGSSNYSRGIFIQTEAASGSSASIPAVPIGVTVSRSGSTALVTWNSVSGATSYEIYYAFQASGPYYLDGIASTNSFTSINWDAEEAGYFKVKAVNAAGPSDYSAYAFMGASLSASSGYGTIKVKNDSSSWTLEVITIENYMTGSVIINDWNGLTPGYTNTYPTIPAGASYDITVKDNAGDVYSVSNLSVPANQVVTLVYNGYSLRASN